MNPIINSRGTKYWYNINGQIHRTDGPAIEYSSGTELWYINGQILTEQKWQAKVLFDNVRISLINERE